MWDRKILKSNAKLVLKENYLPAVLTGLLLTFIAANVYNPGKKLFLRLNGFALSFAHRSFFAAVLSVLLVLIAIILSLAITASLSVLLWNPIEIGCQRILLECRNGHPTVHTLFFIFRNHFLNVGITMLIQTVLILLWSMALIVPGIIASYEYRMVPLLLAEHPEMNWKTALARSRRMMAGNKLDAFVMDLSFIGWQIAAVCTMGIFGILFVYPYVYLTNIELYRALRCEKEN